MLSSEEMATRRAAVITHIRDFHRTHQLSSAYYLVYGCTQECGCDVPNIGRVTLPFCLYPGEMDWFEDYQPLAATDNIDVFWHCLHCNREKVCGAPWLCLNG